ncbi:hypothetical protein H2509_20535 [Stappia sp. F7233]|uniref:Uncharacterized protein n=1 Tax=Stappia albiluteola TaxID=2758565 RepID=A0A839AK59_9HYPH|nr:hypothetical protein [Stappia albiluteola]MBA5779525.1 hypothetical protein [Stappia albiluteola]
MDPELAALVVDARFEELGIVGAYTAPGGEPVSVRVFRSRDEDTAAGFGESRPLVRAVTVQVRASEASPAKGGHFDIGGQVMRVEGQPRIEDPARLIWTCQAVPV